MHELGYGGHMMAQGTHKPFSSTTFILKPLRDEIFEQKIKDRIAKVWGTDRQAAAYKENDELTMAAEE